MSALQTDVLPRHKLTTDDYHRMGEAGIFQEHDRVELIEGDLIDRAPIGNRHATAVRKLIHALQKLTGDRAVLDVQNPIRLSDHSEPEPDMVLLRPRADLYTDAMPTASDVLVLIEVSDTTADYDRRIKLPLYARHGIPEVWLLDLSAGVLERHTGPRSDGYEECEYMKREDTVVPELLPEVSLTLSAIF